MGMHRSGERRFVVKAASACLRRSQRCCCVDIDEGIIRHRGVSLTARGRLSARSSTEIELGEMGSQQSKWKRCYSEEKGREYWKNIDTNIISWESPNVKPGNDNANRARRLQDTPTGADGRFAVENPIMIEKSIQM